MEIKKNVGFLIAIIALVVTGVWFLNEKNAQSLAGLVTSFGVLVKQYLLNEGHKFSKTELSERLIGPVRKIAESLGVKNIGKKGKAELIQEISQKSNRKKWNKPRWAIFVFALVMIPVIKTMLFANETEKELLNILTGSKKLIYVNNWKDSCMLYADYYPLSGNLGGNLWTLLNKADSLASDEIMDNNPINFELHNIIDQTVNEVILNVKVDIDGLDKVLLLRHDQHQLKLSKNTEMLHINEESCITHVGLITPIEKIHSFEFLKSNDHRKISIPVEFIKLSIIYSALVIDNNLEKLMKTPAEKLVPILNVALSYKDVNGKEYNEQFDFVLKHGLGTFDFKNNRLLANVKLTKL